MRIAAVTASFPAISETFIVGELRNLARLGHQVTVFAKRGDEGPIEATDRGLSPTVRHLAIPETRVGRIAGALRIASMRPSDPLGVLARRLLRRDARDGPVHLDVLWLGRALRDGQHDLIHAHFGPAGLEVAALRRAGLSQAPLVATFYGHDATSFPRSAGRDCYVPLFREATWILAVSHRLREHLLALGANPLRTRVHHLGIEPDRFPFRLRRVTQDEPLRIVTVARLVEKKGLDDALEAVAVLAERIGRVEYSIVGEGPLRPRLERRIAGTALEGCVRLRGALGSTAVAAELDRAHAFLLPSKTAADGDEEGTPTAILEAMASGLPVVSTLHAGIPELVEDGVSGLLAPEGEPVLLAEKLESLVRRPEAFSELAVAARRRVERDFDLRMLTRELTEIYSEALAESAAEHGRKPSSL